MPKSTLAPSNTFITLAAPIVNGPARVFFKILSYPNIVINSIEEITNVVILIIKDRDKATIENVMTIDLSNIKDIYLIEFTFLNND